MKIDLDVSKNFNEQFRLHLGGQQIENGFIIDPKFGTNDAKSTYLTFPGGLEFYHFGLTKFKVPIEMKTVNHPDSKWFLVHINLSPVAQEKNINGQLIKLQKHLPIGILFCGPKLEMNTLLPPNTASEVVSIKFNLEFLNNYFCKSQDIFELKKNIAYEDLDASLEKVIYDAVQNMNDRLKCHALILNFLNQLFSILSKHDRPNNPQKIHSKDLEGMLKISVLLRNPIQKNVPTIKEMAVMANMGTTKFKKSFKLVFGKPPKAYRNRIRMEYAQQALIKRLKNPTELSYELGYAHPSNFSLAYKKYFGKLPSDEY